jgi:hypothetical protein
MDGQGLNSLLSPSFKIASMPASQSGQSALEEGRQSLRISSRLLAPRACTVASSGRHGGERERGME